MRGEKQKLKPCPFCGEPAGFVDVSGERLITCDGAKMLDCPAVDIAVPVRQWEKRAELALVANRLGWVSIGPVTFASTPFGSYEVRPNTISFSTYMSHELAIPGEKVAKLSFQSEEEGRYAAQADYDRRVSAAVTLSTPSVQPNVLPIGDNHPDALAVDHFAAAMKTKLAVKRAEGRGGWDDKDDCSQLYLSQLLREHVEKGDPIDVANICMMLHQRGEQIIGTNPLIDVLKRVIDFIPPGLDDLWVDAAESIGEAENPSVQPRARGTDE